MGAETLQAEKVAKPVVEDVAKTMLEDVKLLVEKRDPPVLGTVVDDVDEPASVVIEDELLDLDVAVDDELGGPEVVGT